MLYNTFPEYLYPPRCPICDRISGSGICETCKGGLVYISTDFCMKCGKPLDGDRDEYCRDCGRRKHYFEQGRSLLSYQGQVRQSLYRLKYANRRDYAAVFGREAAVHLGRWIRRLRITRIVPVPLHPSRRRMRGYNQAALIAREIGSQLDLPVDEKLLRRIRKTPPLKTLNGHERQKNLAGAFQVQDEICPGERILLVDDIYTTGHTADAAALCLKQAADCKVYVLTVAIGG